MVREGSSFVVGTSFVDGATGVDGAAGTTSGFRGGVVTGAIRVAFAAGGATDGWMRGTPGSGELPRIAALASQS